MFILAILTFAGAHLTDVAQQHFTSQSACHAALTRYDRHLTSSDTAVGYFADGRVVQASCDVLR